MVHASLMAANIAEHNYKIRTSGKYYTRIYSLLRKLLFIVYILIGIFRMLNNGNDIPKDMFREIIKRVYVKPEDRGVSVVYFLHF